MAVNLKPTQTNETGLQLQVPGTNPPAEPQPYDIQADRARVADELAHSPEIEALTAQIDVGDMGSIVTFGASCAEEISRASDAVLQSMTMSQIDESGKMFQQLGKIMAQFDIDELRGGVSGIERFFPAGARRKLEQVLSKYTTMGDEVDKIYEQLRSYEVEITDSNAKLAQMFEANVACYHQLVKYIVAGERGCQEISEYLEQRKRDMQQTGDQSIIFEIQTLEQALQLLQQRVQDLRTAELIALQSVPMLKTMEISNLNLVRKINSAFVITLPVFKQSLAQAIMLKRQRIQARAISTLDERTNELLIKNARNATEQARMTASLAAGSSVKVETLEQTWQSIMTGVDDAKRIQEETARKRKEDQARLERIKQDYMKKAGRR